MTHGQLLDQESLHSILRWAAQRATTLTISLHRDGQWSNLRSRLLHCDRNLVQISYPLASGDSPIPEISVGDEIGVAFRRGHKKCLFVSSVVMRRAETSPDGTALDALILQVPKEMRELQRRAYQRVMVPRSRFIAVKVWLGGLPTAEEPSWPVCAGRIANISAGGILVDIRADQNPRLAVGDIVGLEITHQPGHAPLLIEAQYRHCAVSGPERIGLGLQFFGLERETAGRATLAEIADLVKCVTRDATRAER